MCESCWKWMVALSKRKFWCTAPWEESETLMRLKVLPVCWVEIQNKKSSFWDWGQQCFHLRKTPELLESTPIQRQKNCVVINLVKHEEPSLHQPNGFLITSQPLENCSTHIAQVFHRTEWILDLTSGHRWTLVILTHPDRLDSNIPSIEKSG